MTAPATTQQRAAIRLANEVRAIHAQVKANLKAQPTVNDGRLLAAQLLDELHPDHARLRVEPFLRAIPSHGRDRVRRLLIAAQIVDPNRRLGELTERQRHTIASILRVQLNASARRGGPVPDALQTGRELFA